MELHPVIVLDVGGRIFKVLRETLMKYPDSTVARVVAGKDLANMVIVDGTYFFDRNPDYFTLILDFIRNDKWFVNHALHPEQLLAECAFWNIHCEYTAAVPKAPHIAYEPTLLLDNNRIDPTLLIADNSEPALKTENNYEPTLLIEENPTVYEPTLLFKDSAPSTSPLLREESVEISIEVVRKPKKEDNLLDLIVSEENTRKLPWEAPGFTPKKRATKTPAKQPAKKPKNEETKRTTREGTIPKAEELAKALELMDSPRKKFPTTPQFLLSGIQPAQRIQLERQIISLGGTVVSSFEEHPEYLLMEKYARTLKLLESIVRGTELVSVDWVYESTNKRKWLNPKDFLLVTPEVEQKNGFSYEQTMEKTRKGNWFLKGLAVYVSNGTNPRNDVQGLCALLGAQILEKEPTEVEANTLIISSKDSKDTRLNNFIRKNGGKIYTKEVILKSILVQEFLINREEFIIK